MIADDFFRQRDFQRLLAAGWTTVYYPANGPLWKSPDGRELLTENEALARVRMETQDGAD